PLPLHDALPIYADRLPRHARVPGYGHADRDLAALRARPLQPGPPLRLRGGGLVLALRGRGLAGPVPVRLRALTRRRPRKTGRGPAMCRPEAFAVVGRRGRAAAPRRWRCRG